MIPDEVVELLWDYAREPRSQPEPEAPVTEDAEGTDPVGPGG